MNPALSQLVRRRADWCCEYCRLPQNFDDTTFEVDHIIAKKHGGKTTPGNLALSCVFCNQQKGSNIAGLDWQTRKLSPLYNPRRHKWAKHFRWQGPRLIGLTPVGRTTVSVLSANQPDRVSMREALIEEGQFPPEIAGPDPG